MVKAPACDGVCTYLSFHSLMGSTVRTRGGKSSYSLPFCMARLIHSSVAMLEGDPPLTAKPFAQCTSVFRTPCSQQKCVNRTLIDLERRVQARKALFLVSLSNPH